MGLFGYTPKISKDEFSRACSNLRSYGFTDTEINKLKAVFSGDLDETGYEQSCVDSGELKRKIDLMKENRSVYGFSDEKLKTMEKVFKEYL